MTKSVDLLLFGITFVQSYFQIKVEHTIFCLPLAKILWILCGYRTIFSVIMTRDLLRTALFCILATVWIFGDPHFFSTWFGKLYKTMSPFFFSWKETIGWGKKCAFTYKSHPIVWHAYSFAKKHFLSRSSLYLLLLRLDMTFNLPARALKITIMAHSSSPCSCSSFPSPRAHLYVVGMLWFMSKT